MWGGEEALILPPHSNALLPPYSGQQRVGPADRPLPGRGPLRPQVRPRPPRDGQEALPDGRHAQVSPPLHRPFLCCYLLLGTGARVGHALGSGQDEQASPPLPTQHTHEVLSAGVACISKEGAQGCRLKEPAPLLSHGTWAFSSSSRGNVKALVSTCAWPLHCIPNQLLLRG